MPESDMEKLNGETKLGFDITYCDICGPITRCDYDECEYYEEKIND